MTAVTGIEVQTAAMDARDNGEFIRLVRAGAQVWTRRGLRGTPGTTSHEVLSNAPAASKFVRHSAHEWSTTHGGITAFATADSPYMPTEVNPTQDDPETAFLGQWARAVHYDYTDSTNPRRRHWVLATGLCHERGLDRGANTLVEYLQATPHTIDVASDRIVAQVHRLPNIVDRFGLRIKDATRYVGQGVEVLSLGPAHVGCAHGAFTCAPCATRQAELLEFLTRDQDVVELSAKHLRTMTDAARRLTSPRR